MASMDWASGIGAGLGAVASLVQGNETKQANRRAGERSQQAAQEAKAGVNNSQVNQSYAQGGAAANNLRLQLLGVPGAGTSYGQGTPDYGSYFSANKDLQDSWNGNAKLRTMFNNDSAAFARNHYETAGKAEGRQLATSGGIAPGAPSGAGPGGAFQNFLDSTGYKTQMQSGVDALDLSASSKGLRNSGANQRAVQRFGAGMGQQYFENYLGQLDKPASQGLQAGMAVNDANVNLTTGGAAQNNGYQIAGQNAENAGVAGATKNIAGGINAIWG